jgi:uncharacterized membrane protein YcaP (DUF421 family)
MFTDFTHLSVSPLDLIIRTMVVYVVVLALIRLAGRKQIAQMGPTELVAMLLISNAVQNSMNAGDNSLLGGLISAATLITLSHVVSWLTYRHRRMSALIEGKSLTLVLDGKVQRNELRKILMPAAQLHTLLMLQGVQDIRTLSKVVIDPEGRLIVIKKDSEISPELNAEIQP